MSHWDLSSLTNRSDGTMDVSSRLVKILTFKHYIFFLPNERQNSVFPSSRKRKCFSSVFHAWIQNLRLTQFHGNLKYFHVEVILVNIYVFLISCPLICICKITLHCCLKLHSYIKLKTGMINFLPLHCPRKACDKVYTIW